MGHKAQSKVHLREEYRTTSLCFLDGHTLNILRLVNLEECRLYGMNSHDCLVFMQTLISLTYRDLLQNEYEMQS